MTGRHRKLRMEQMEARQMMAGDIAAFVQDGNLFINENSAQLGADNGVLVHQLENGKIRVEGNTTPTDKSVSTINGKAFEDFDVPGNLVVKLGGGSDRVVVGPSVFNQVSIDTGSTVLNRIATSTVIQLVPDKDEITIDGLRTRGSMSVNTGIDHDVVYFGNSEIGDVGSGASVKINTGAGPDSVVLASASGVTVDGSVDIQTYSSLSEKDVDTVYAERLQLFGDLHVRTGDGNDQITLKNMIAYRGVIDFDAGAGADSATLDHVTAIDSLMAHMGDGDDTLYTNYLNVDKLTLDGGAGYDKFNQGLDQYIGSRVVTGFELINGGRLSSDGLPTLSKL